jgi:hypothetical protein
MKTLRVMPESFREGDSASRSIASGCAGGPRGPRGPRAHSPITPTRGARNGRAQPYADPTLRVAASEAEEPSALASRWARLGAAILDSLIVSAIFVPLQWFGGFWSAAMNAASNGYSLPLGTTLLWAAIGMVVFVIV